MALELKHLHRENSRSAVVEIVGACAHRDHVALEDLFHRIDALPVDRLVLDMSGLGGINDDLVGCLAVWRRRYLDRGARFIFVDPNVVVRWVLERKLGSDLELAASVEDVLEDVVEQDHESSPQPEIVPAQTRTMLLEPTRERPTCVLNASRPDRHILAGVMTCLGGDVHPSKWRQSLSSALARAGLAAGLELCVLRGGRFEVVGHPHHELRADGWLASYLSGADCPLARDEVGHEGLADDERGFLSWCRADVIVPIVAQERLIGILALRSGRQGGMSGYRSGEVLALALLSRHLAGPLAAMMEETTTQAEEPFMPEVVLPRA